jgi:hypothetical protein
MATSDAEKAKAQELHEKAQSLDDEAALAMYREALVLDPHRPATHYNIGLIYKYQGKWQESLWHNEQAAALRPNDEATNWNLAIAATALRDWRTARDAWRSLGIDIDSRDGPIECDFGMTPVRLNPESAGEVVWARRVDPVRARIANVPYPASGFRGGDLVLHDGAATGYREIDGREYPVFNVLELFESSRLNTYEAEVVVGRPDDIETLISALEVAGILHEDWTVSVRILCKQCSEGRPHEHHDQELKRELSDRHVLGIASADQLQVDEVFQKWTTAWRRAIRFELKLSPIVCH